jgi:hypothetical protein
VSVILFGVVLMEASNKLTPHIGGGRQRQILDFEANSRRRLVTRV